MTALSNVTANANENENAVSRVQVWLNGIVEAFGHRNCEPPINAADRPSPLCSLSIRFTIHGKLQYSLGVDTNQAVFISASSSFLAKSCFFNRASTSAGR